MVRSFFVPLALAALLTPAFAAPASYAIVEGFDSIPSGWEQMAPASPKQVLNLRLSLAPANTANFLDTVLSISTPGHASYGQFLSPEQLQDLIAPVPTASNAVTSWLTEHDISAKSIQKDRNWLALKISVEQAENLLQTKFYDYKSTTTGEVRTLTLQYSVPQTLIGYIETIQPTTDFGEVQGLPRIQAYLSPEATSPGNTQITPACLQSLYGLPAARVDKTSPGIAVPGFVNEYANHADLSLFLKQFRPDLNPQPSFTVASVDGGLNDQSQPGVEANLDTQYTVGLTNGIENTFISSGLPTVQGLLDVISYVANLPNPPTVLSTSYGFNENALTSSNVNSVCNAFAQLGARGVSVIVASGDGGVAGFKSHNCSTFVPTFPASCPYVTAVGATTGVRETGSTFSSGGFSNFFSRPLYQELAVGGYLTGLQSEYSGRFNATGRAYPDVAAQGENVVIELGGNLVLVDGTRYAFHSAFNIAVMRLT